MCNDVKLLGVMNRGRHIIACLVVESSLLSTSSIECWQILQEKNRYGHYCVDLVTF